MVDLKLTNIKLLGKRKRHITVNVSNASYFKAMAFIKLFCPDISFERS